MHRTHLARLCSATALTALALLAVSGCNKDDYADPANSDSGRPSSSASANPTTASPDGKRHVVDAAEAGGLAKLTGDGALSDVPVDPGEMRDDMTLVAANYRATGTDDDPVLFEGVDNVPEDTNKRREHLWRGMLEYVEWDPELGQPEAQPVEDAGPLGGSVECMLASLSEDGNVICGWADEGTAGVALFPDSTLPEAEKLFVQMRSDLEHQGN